MLYQNGDVKIYYEDHGIPDKTALVFIHGFPLDHSMWDASVEYFKKKYRVVTFDIRGLGRSTTSDLAFTFEFIVDDLICLLDFLSIKQCVAVGISMGGYVALRAFERDNECFKALVLCDTQSAADNNFSLLGRHKNIEILRDKGLDAFAEKFIANLLSPVTVRNRKDLVRDFCGIVKKQSAKGLSAMLTAIATRTNTDSILKEISIPVLLLAGQDDKVTPAENMQAMAAEIAKSEFFVIPETGHMAPFENPDLFQKIFSDFLNKNKL